MPNQAAIIWFVVGVATGMYVVPVIMTRLRVVGK